MESLLILIASLIIVGLITWRLLTGSLHEQRKETKSSHSFKPLDDRGPRAAAVRLDGDFRAVSLRICNQPCQAALAARNKPILLGAAPKLPLPGCDRACHCELIPHADRRVKKDRRYPSENFVKVNRKAALEDHRGKSDRRARRYVYKGID